METSRRRRRAAGLTLVEALIALAVAAVLGSLVLPAFRAFVERQQADVAIRRVAAAVRFTRASAVSLAEPVVLCGGRPEAGCDGDWQAGMFVIRDRHLDAPDAGTVLLHAFAPPPAGSRLAWRAFGTRRFLRMLPRGHTDWQNGRFVYCPPSGDPAHARALVINVQGRARLVHDTDGDGVIEDRRGRPLAC